MKQRHCSKLLLAVALLIALVPAAFAQPNMTGRITASGSAVTVTGIQDYGSLGLQIQGTFTGTLQFEGTVGDATWANVNGYLTSTGAGATSATAAGVWQIQIGGMQSFRVRASAFASGIAEVSIRLSRAGYAPSASVGSVTVGAVDQGAAGVAAWLMKGAGTAGTADTGVVTVQGIASGTPLTAKVQDGSGNAITSTASALDVNIKSGVTQDIAEGSAAGTPVTVAGRADTTENAAVDDGDVVRLATDIVGRAVVNLHAVPQLQFSATTGTALNATTGQTLVAADATYKLCITSIAIANADASNGEIVQILEGGQIGTGTLLASYAAASGYGGTAYSMPTPLCTSAVNKSLDADSTGSANPVYVTITYVKRIN